MSANQIILITVGTTHDKLHRLIFSNLALERKPFLKNISKHLAGTEAWLFKPVMSHSAAQVPLAFNNYFAFPTYRFTL